MAADDPTVTNWPSDVQGPPSRAGKYRIVGRIGQGGMGIVYRAVDEDLGRTVALKFLPPELGHDSNEAQRFLREARAASALDHVNIGTIFGVEETSDRRRFIVMAYYEGRDLGARMRDQAQPLSPAEALGIAIQVARGLAAAHARGVIHRDIKPSNILLTPQGVVKIVDFGLASISGAGQLTLPGTRMGTPAYMSPEQASGKSVDQRSDIWSLAVVLLEMLTCQRVFAADTSPGVLHKVVQGEIPTLGRVPQPLRSVLARALEKEPAKRYHSADDFLAALEALQPAAAVLRPLPPAAPSTRPAAAIRAAMRGWRGLVVALILLAAIAVGTPYVWKAVKSAHGRPAIAGAPASDSVFDKYLQGVELIKRWDKQGNLEQAVKLFTEATQADPTFALGFARLAEAQRLRYALAGDKTILEAATKAAAEGLRLNPDLSTVQVAWGRVQALLGNKDLAMMSFGRAVRIDPNDADAQLAIARQYERLGRISDAEAAYRKAGSLEPDSIAAHDYYANFLFRQSRLADAIREFQTVVRIAPDDAPAYVGLGAALNESGKIDEAITVYLRALQLKPTDMGYSNLGTAYSRTGRYQEAVAAYRKALELNANKYLVWGNLAFVQSWMNGMNDQTRQTFARAIELGEQSRKDNLRDPSVHCNLALYYAKTGNAPLARQRIETAQALSPKGPETLAAAAEVYELLGQRKKALEFAKRALGAGYARQRLQQDPELAKLMADLK
jgi:serine/threonine-protein kinase